MRLQSSSRPASSRQLFLPVLALALSVLSCGREPTGNNGEPNAGVRYSRGLAFNGIFPEGYAEYQSGFANQSSNSVAYFDRVRIILRNPDGTVAKDTVVDFPAGVDEVPVVLNLPIPASAPASGLQLTGSFAYQNGNEVIFTTQTFAVTATPATPNSAPPPPVVINVPVTYVGPGASATGVIITPKTQSVNTGGSFSFTARAVDAAGNTVPNTPIAFESQSPLATITNAATGVGVAGNARGTANIIARLLTGPSDNATLTIIAPPSSIAQVSGNNQTANVNAQLANPVVVQVNATDGQPASGVNVTFAAQNGGTVGNAAVTTGADGRAQTTWRLGATAGAQSLTASAAGLTGSPVTFSATANALPPVRVLISTQPLSSIAAGTDFGLVASVVDVNGAVTPSFTGPITIALSTFPVGAALQGTLTANAVAGVATFSALRLNVPGSYAITATGSSLIAATTNTFVITSGAANKLVFGQYPILGAAAGVTFDPIVVNVRDAIGNPVTSFTGPVTLGIETGPAGATVTGTTTVNAVAGVATFNGISLTMAGAYMLRATGSGLTSAIGPSFSITPGPASQLLLVSGGGQAAIGGAALPNPVIVRVADFFGNGVAGKTVTFSPVASSVTPTSAVSDGAGLVQTMWTIGSTAGPYTLNVSSVGLSPNPLAVTASATTTTGPGPATQIAITTQPSNTASGAAITPAIVVTAKDASGLTATSYTGNVTLAITTNPAGGTLAGTATVAAVAGIATFSNLSINLAGNGYVLTASSGSFTPVASSAFNITPGAATSLAFTAAPPNLVAGTTFSTAPIVKARDANNNVVTSFTSNISMSIGTNPGAGTLSGTNTVAAVAGSATFSNLSIDKAGAGYTIIATSGALTVTSAAFSVSPAAASIIAVQSGNAQTGTAGAPLASPFIAKITDAFGNPVSGVNVTWSVTAGGGSLAGTTNSSDVNGLVQTTLTLGPAAGSNTVTVTSAGLTGSPLSFTATAGAGAATKLVILQQPTNAVAGASISPAIVVQAQDVNNNPVTSYPTAISISITTNPGTSVLGGTLSVVPTSGSSTFNNLTLDKVGTGYVLTASSGGLASAVSSAFNITAAAAANLIVGSGDNQTGVAGAVLASPIVAKVSDAFGNPVSGVNVTWNVTAGGGSLSGTTTSTNASGTVQTNWTLGATVGANQVTVTSAGLTGSPLTFNASSGAGAATKIVFTGQPGNGTAGVALTPSPSVQVQDANNNVVASYATNITLTLTTNPGGATLGGGTVSPPTGGNAAFAVSLDKVGAGYQLTASSGALTTAVSNTFNIVAAPASQIVVQSGNGQGGTVNAALAAPFIAKVTDAFGNPVSGISVTWAVASGGGSLSGTTSSTDAAGLVQTTLTLGSTAGVNTVTATSGSLTGSPLTFTASSSAGVATKLVFTTQPANVVAGVDFTSAPAVQAQDAFNNPVASYATNISIAITTNPGGATLGGVTSVSPGSGLSTFIGLSLNKTGVGYVLTASSGGLATAVSNAFTVTPAAASQILVDAGNAQSGVAGAVLANPFVAQVVDAFGNGVPGAGVTWAVATGGGSLGGTISTTDAQGKAQTTLTLGIGAGANSVTATSGSLTGSPLTFTATGIPGAATKLVFSTQPSNAVAGANLSPSPVVQAQDANNNVVGSYAPNIVVALATNPGTSTLGGTTSVAPTSGQATFSTLTLDKIGVGYTMTATSGVLATATSNTFNITAAAASAISAETGNNQTVNVPAALGAPIVARVVDAFGNPVSGVSVTWGTPTNGGNLTGTTTTTDANGRVTATWNLVNLGPQTVTATSGSLAGSPVTFTSTGTTTLANAVWTGAVSTAFNVAGNWSPAVVPGATDAVLIQSGGNQPTLAGQTDLKDLYLQPGATLNANGFTINLTGNLDAGTTITGAANVNLNGTGTLKGLIIGGVTVNGTYTLAGYDSLTSNLTVASGGSLTIGANRVKVEGNFATTGTGVLNMSNASSVMVVTGNVSFGGGVSTLSDGILQFFGNFSQSGAAGSHNATGNHNTWFSGGTPSFSFADQTGASKFNHVLFNAGTVTANTSFRARAIQLGAGIGNLVGVDETIKAMVIDSIIDPNARWAVPKAVFVGANAYIGNNLGGTAVSFSGGATTNLLSIAAVNGSVTVDNGTTLVLGANSLTVGTDFATSNGGKLDMSNASSALNVNGNTTFGGGTSILTDGTLTFAGGFTQSTSSAAFAATGAHTTTLTGGNNQAITFANADLTTGATCASSCFANLTVSKTGGDVTTSSPIRALGNVAIGSGINSFSAVGDGETARGLSVDGNFSSNGASSVHIGNLRVKGNAITLDAETTTIDTLNYAGGAGQSLLDRGFDKVIISGTPTVGADHEFSNMVIVTGTLNPNGHTLKIPGTLVTTGTGVLTGSNAADSVEVESVSFGGGTSAPSDGRLVVWGNFAQTGPAFRPTGNHVTYFANDNGEASQAINGTATAKGDGPHHVKFLGYAYKYITGVITFTGDVFIGYGSGTVGSGGGALAYVGGTLVEEQLAALRADGSALRLPASSKRAVNAQKLARFNELALYVKKRAAARVVERRELSVPRVRTPRVEVPRLGGKATAPALRAPRLTPAGLAAAASVKVASFESYGTWQVENTNIYGTSIDVPAMSTNLVVSGQTVLQRYMELVGDLTIQQEAGSPGEFDLGGNGLDVYGNLSTAASGKLKMIENEGVTITGSATFAGGTSEFSSGGYFEAMGSFTQAGGAADAYAPPATFETYIGYYDAYCGECVQLRADARARRPAVRGNVRPQAAKLMANDVDGSGISFANPGEGAGTSHFGMLYLQGLETVLSSDVYALSTFETGESASHAVYASSGTKSLVSHGADVRNVTFDYVKWELLDGYSVYSMDDVTFNTMPDDVDQFTVNRVAGGIGCDGPCLYLWYWTFNTVPSTGNYVKAVNASYGVRMQSPNPSAHGGHISGPISGWVSAWIWTGAFNTSWTSPGNWQGSLNATPGSNDDVTIGVASPNAPLISGVVGVRNLTIQTGASIDLTDSGDLYVYGSLVGPTATTAITCSSCEGSGLVKLLGEGGPYDLEGSYLSLQVGDGEGLPLSNYRVTGTLNAEKLFVNSGDFTVHTGTVNISSQFRTQYIGRLIMDHASGQLNVNGSVIFSGLSTSGLLTDGTIAINNGLLSASGSSPSAFFASGAHKVTFSGTSTISLNDPNNSAFNDLTFNAGSSTTLYSNVHVLGTLTRGAGTSGVSITASGAPTNFYNLQVNGVNVGTDPTTFNSVSIRMEDAGTFTAFNNVSFTGFTGFNGYVLDVARSGTTAMSALNFSLVTGLASGYYVALNSSGTLNITGSNPATGILDTHYKINVGGGTVSWVP